MARCPHGENYINAYGPSRRINDCDPPCPSPPVVYTLLRVVIYYYYYIEVKCRLQSQWLDTMTNLRLLVPREYLYIYIYRNKYEQWHVKVNRVYNILRMNRICGLISPLMPGDRTGGGHIFGHTRSLAACIAGDTHTTTRPKIREKPWEIIFRCV